MIMVAPTGARRSKADHPALPVTLDETVATARACHTAGASAFHLHVRDDTGAHSLDVYRYRDALAALREAVPTMRVQVTTEAAGRFSVAEQYACLTRLNPDWISLSVREAARDLRLAPKLYAAAAEMGTEIQHILYDARDAALLADWQRRGIVPDAPQSVILVLGRYGDGPPSDPAALPAFLTALPPVARWMVCAFGSTEHACLRAAHARGGDLRVGFENSLQAPSGQLWPDNASSVRALAQALTPIAQVG